MRFNYKQFVLLILTSISFIQCAHKDEKIEATSFQFTISEATKGKITNQQGTVSVECQEDRIVLFFKESIEGRTDADDLLVGEIILGFQLGDTIGTYPLNGISGKREENVVGIASFLDVLKFDAYTAQYISNPVRYEKIKNGSVEITEWSTEKDGILKGKLNTTLINENKTIRIQGEFAVRWKEENINCE